MSNFIKFIYQPIIYQLYLVLYWEFELFKNLIRNFNYSDSRIPLKMVRLGKIIYSLKRDPLEIARREDFTTWDNGFAPFSILKSGNWILYSLDKRGAIFVELPKNFEEYTIDKHPLSSILAFEKAQRTAELKLDGFVDFANNLERVGEPPRTLLFISGAGCASTLFGTLLNHPDHSVVIAEPHALACLSIGYGEGYWSEEKIDLLLPALMKILWKNIRTELVFVIKTTPAEVRLVPYFKRLMPDVRHAFMFRKGALDLVEKIILQDTLLLYIFHLYIITPGLTPLEYGWLHASEGQYFRKLKPRNSKEFSMIWYAASYAYYIKYKEAFDFPIIWHDEFMDDPECVLRPIFEKFTIPETCLYNALNCLEHEEKNTIEDALGAVQVQPLTPKLETSLRQFAEHMHIPKEIIGL